MARIMDAHLANTATPPIPGINSTRLPLMPDRWQRFISEPGNWGDRFKNIFAAGFAIGHIFQKIRACLLNRFRIGSRLQNTIRTQQNVCFVLK